MLDPIQPTPAVGEVRMGDPAGCLSLETYSTLATGMDMLVYADSLISLDWTLRRTSAPGCLECGYPAL